MKFTDKQDRAIFIRRTTVDDCRATIPFRRTMLAERLPYIMAGEDPTPESQREFIERHQGEGKILLSAWDSDAIVGLCGAARKENEQQRHIAVLGISVAKSHRGSGIGTQLLQSLIDWARETGVRRLSLEMIEGNPAERLYERMGFEHEGIQRQAHCHEGQYMDVVLMARLFL